MAVATEHGLFVNGETDEAEAVQPVRALRL
jgi:hypothetical protein